MCVRFPILYGLPLLALAEGGCLSIRPAQAQSPPLPTASARSVAPKRLPKPPAAKLLFNAKEIPGRYYFGDGLGVNCSLTLAKSGRFRFSWHGCLGEYDRNLGKWTWEGDVVVLHPEKPNSHEGFEGVNVRFVPVKWGARHYLVDENEMPGFCASARSKETPFRDGIHGNDYVKSTEGDLPPVKGAPIVPQRYRTYYEKGPVDAKVVRIDGSGHAILDKGSADRVKPGMLLAIQGFERMELRVLSAEPHQAVAQPRYYWNSDRRVRVGDAFTSGGYFNRPRGTGTERFPAPPPVKSTF